MTVPGGVVVEGRLLASPEAGASSPLTITVTKGNLEYFGRLLISLPSDCQLRAKQLHGGGMTVDKTRNLAVISWLKLPDAQQFDLLFDLDISPQAVPGPRTLEWDFSFIRNNDRETVRPTPFHFEVSQTRTAQTNRSIDSGVDDDSKDTVAQEVVLRSPSALRTIRELRDGRIEVNIEFENIPSGGFVKCVETLPEDATTNVTSGGGSIVQSAAGTVSFVWFDYQHAGNLTYITELPQLYMPGDFIGVLSLILGDTAIEIPVLNSRKVEIPGASMEYSSTDAEDIWYEIQVAATKNRVVTDYFEQKLNFSLPLVEEKDSMWVKYLFGHFEGYRLARDCREDFNKRFGFIGPFVVSKRNGNRISVQEAITRSGEIWVP